MAETAERIDPSLAEGVSVFRAPSGWALRRRDGVFVRIGGADDELAETPELRAHPRFGPAFAAQGLLADTVHGEHPPALAIEGRGVLHDVVGPILRAAAGPSSGTLRRVVLVDAPPPPNPPTTDGVVVWPEGASVFISPLVDDGDAHPVPVADVLTRRVAASPTPDLLAAYFRGRRRAPVVIPAAAGLLVASLTLEQVTAGVDARRRLREVDLDENTWIDRTVLGVPNAPTGGHPPATEAP